MQVSPSVRTLAAQTANKPETCLPEQHLVCEYSNRSMAVVPHGLHAGLRASSRAVMAAAKQGYWPSGNGAEVCTAGFGGGVSSVNATAPLPKRNKDGTFIFEDAPLLRPNLAPWEVLQVRAVRRKV